jgi:alkanesulfonate monooxygenase SsuD/methylene tetrahydromethanopterin reductase-like flavin-dependent oxidoreductase (luciferase family)
MCESDRELTFGSFLYPNLSEGAGLLAQATLAEDLGYDLLGVPDHPGNVAYADQWSLMAFILGATRRLEVFGAVTSLAMREPPAVLAKAALTLDLLAPGRFHLGLGTGSNPSIVPVGGRTWAPAEAVDRLREALAIIQLIWSGAGPGTFDGRYYSLTDAPVPRAPSTSLDVWVGCLKPRMRELVAKRADGWIPALHMIDPDVIRPQVEHMNDELDKAGRPRTAVRRVYNTIAKKVQAVSEDFLVGPASQWVDQLTYVALELGFDTFLFGDPHDGSAHLRRVAEEVIPQLRINVASARRATARQPCATPT